MVSYGHGKHKSRQLEDWKNTMLEYVFRWLPPFPGMVGQGLFCATET